MKNKKGSITVIFIILLSMSNLLVRTNRIILSHTFLERGIYSIDERASSYNIIIKEYEDYLNREYDSKEKFIRFSELERNKNFGSFIITSKKSIYDTIILEIKNKNNQHTVEAKGWYDDDLSKITLKRSSL